MSFFEFPLAADYSDTQISDFGAFTFAQRAVELAPTLLQLRVSADTVGAVALRIFFAAAVGASEQNQIEIFNQNVIIGPIPVGVYVGFAGGQGGCQRVFRNPTTGVPFTLRMSSTGLAGINSVVRGEYIWARGAV